MTPIEWTVTRRLAALRQRLSDLEWAGQAETVEAHRITREIAYLSEYARLGYTHEPAF